MICSWLKHHLFFKKTFSLIALFAFIMTFVLMDAWAEAADASVITTPDKTEEHLQLDVDTLTISPHIGTVKFSRKGKSNKTIIHIQDAHCNYGAQKSISKIIEYLNTEYGIEYINLEGGAGDYDLSVFTDISNRAIRSRVADYFMKWGQVNGAEFYALSNPDKVTLWGVEEPDLYLKNLNIYRESLDYKEDANRHLRELKYFINNLKRHIFPKELLELDIKYTQYKARNLKFKDYLIFLLSKARQEGIDIRLYPNIYLLSQSLKEEDKIDFQKANKERDRLIDELQQVLSKRELKELAAKTLGFRNKRLSQIEFYGYLARKAAQGGQEIGDYPDLRRYIIYVSLYNAVDKTAVMNEITAIESCVKEPFYENEKQRELDVLSRNLVLTENLFNVMFTKDDYGYYKKNRATFDLHNFITFIKREAPLYGITAKIDGNIEKLDLYRERMFEFYECSHERDRSFLKNIMSAGQEPSAGILVTGGFHTENLLELLEENDFSYVSIIPNFDNEEDYQCPYFEVLSGQGMSPVEESLGTAFSSIQVASLLNSLGTKADGVERAELFRRGVMIFESMCRSGKNVQAVELDDGRYLVLRIVDGALTVEIQEKDDLASDVPETDAGKERKTPPDHKFAILSGYGFLGLGGGLDWTVLSGALFVKSIVYPLMVSGQALSGLGVVLGAVFLLFAVTSFVRVRASWRAVSTVYPDLGIWRKLTLDVGHDKVVMDRLGEISPYTYNRTAHHEGFRYHVSGLLAFVPFAAVLRNIFIKQKQIHAPPARPATGLLKVAFFCLCVILLFAPEFLSGKRAYWAARGNEVTYAQRSAGAQRDSRRSIAYTDNILDSNRWPKNWDVFYGGTKSVDWKKGHLIVKTDFNEGRKKGGIALYLGEIRDLTGHEITLKVTIPKRFGSAGNNCIQLYAKDGRFKWQDTGWREVQRPGECTLTYTPATQGGYTDPGFDPTRIAEIGVMFVLNDASPDDNPEEEIEITGLGIRSTGEVQEEARQEPVYRKTPRTAGKVSAEDFVNNSGQSFYPKEYEGAIGTDRGIRSRRGEISSLFSRAGKTQRVFLTIGSKNTSGIQYMNDIPVKWKDKDGAVKDLVELVRLAKKAKTKVGIVLHDFSLGGDASAGGHPDVLTDANKTKAMIMRDKELLRAALKELGKDREWIKFIEIMNEPDNVDPEIPIPDVQRFVEQGIEMVRGIATDTPISLGTGKVINAGYYIWMLEPGDDWQIRAYPDALGEIPGETMADKFKYIAMNLNVPKGVRIILGEAPAHIIEGEWVISDIMDAAMEAGLSGVCFWFDNKKDESDVRYKFDPDTYNDSVGDLTGEPVPETRVSEEKEPAPREDKEVKTPEVAKPVIIGPENFIVQGDEWYLDLRYSGIRGLDIKASGVDLSKYIAIEFTFKKGKSARIQPFVKSPDWKNVYAYPSTPKKGKVIFRFTTDSLNVSQFSDFSSVASIGAAVFGEDAEAALSKLESVRLISSESDLIGKVYGRDGQLLIGGFEVEEGRDKIIVTHEEIDPIEVELAREVPEVSGQQLIDSLKVLPDSEGNTLTISEKQAITGLIGRIGSNEFDKVVAIEDHESVMGIFGKGTLYINKNFINNPLGLLHETAEGMLALPDGYEHLNVHTFMRGAGKDVRVAYDLLVNKAGAERVNEMAAEDEDRFMDALDETMKESDLRSMTETEKDLIRYNYSQLQERGDRTDIGAKMLLFGLQDHIDPAGNIAFTRDIGKLVDLLRQNCLNIVLVRVPSIETAAAQEKFARKGSRKFTKMGVTTRVSHYDTDLEEQLERALALATEAKNQALLPKIAVHCLEESDRETAENFKGRLAEQQQNMFVIINDISPVAVNVNDIKVDEIKVIAVANVILNDKRLRDDFNLSVDDEMLVTMRRDMLSFFSRCGFFGEQDQSLDFSGMSAEELDSFMKELYRGAMYLRITRVNWKELRVWNDAQNAILRSL